MRDVLGELPNMIVGNVKYLLAKGIQLSMPCVGNAGGYGRRVAGTGVRQRQAFRGAEGLLWVTILATHC